MFQKRIRASVACVENDQILLVLLRDPLTRVERWFPPGGKIEPNETPAVAAVRETLEETGYKIDVESETEFVIDYRFTWNGQDYDCTTHFFRARLSPKPQSPQVVADADYLLASKWFPVADLPKVLGYDRTILESCLRLVDDAAHGDEQR